MYGRGRLRVGAGSRSSVRGGDQLYIGKIIELTLSSKTGFSPDCAGKKRFASANSRKRSSEYLAQSRKGRKGRRKNVKIIRKNIYLSPSNLVAFAPWREEYPNPRTFDFRKI
jgi:hypothetical protein